MITKNYRYNLNLLSKYRTQLMGIATILITFYHMSYYIETPIIRVIQKVGYGGVDFFLFVSGLGIYFALKNRVNIKSFYKKRLIRILPIYFPIVLPFSIFAILVLQYPLDYLFHMSTLTNWFASKQSLDNWYISFIIFLYIITPLYYPIFNKNKEISTIAISLIFIAFSIFITITDFHKIFLIASVRVPIYFIGFYIGYLIDKNTIFNIKKLFFIYITLILGFVALFYCLRSFSFSNLWSNGLWWYPFIFITCPLCILLTQIFNIFKEYKFPILSFFGKYSLPIYLLYEKVLKVSDFYMKDTPLLLVNIIAMIITFILAYFLQKIIYTILKQHFNRI